MCWAVAYGVGEDACGFRCSGQRLSRGQSAWAEERNTGKTECMGGLGRNEKRMHGCPYVLVLCENITQKVTK